MILRGGFDQLLGFFDCLVGFPLAVEGECADGGEVRGGFIFELGENGGVLAKGDFGAELEDAGGEGVGTREVGEGIFEDLGVRTAEEGGGYVEEFCTCQLSLLSSVKIQ